MARPASQALAGYFPTPEPLVPGRGPADRLQPGRIVFRRIAQNAHGVAHHQVGAGGAGERTFRQLPVDDLAGGAQLGAQMRVDSVTIHDRRLTQ